MWKTTAAFARQEITFLISIDIDRRKLIVVTTKWKPVGTRGGVITSPNDGGVPAFTTMTQLQLKVVCERRLDLNK